MLPRYPPRRCRRRAGKPRAVNAKDDQHHENVECQTGVAAGFGVPPGQHRRGEVAHLVEHQHRQDAAFCSGIGQNQGCGGVYDVP